MATRKRRPPDPDAAGELPRLDHPDQSPAVLEDTLTPAQRAALLPQLEGQAELDLDDPRRGPNENLGPDHPRNQ